MGAVTMNAPVPPMQVCTVAVVNVVGQMTWVNAAGWMPQAELVQVASESATAGSQIGRAHV